MAEFSALPLFTDAYLADTRHLTTLQHGAYLLMIMTAWRSPDCALPDNDAFLARITGLDKRTWNANKETLLAFWRLNDEQKWVQGRLLDERNRLRRPPAKVSLYPTDWRALREIVFERDDYACTYCSSEELPLHCDHIVPLTRGGTNDLSNLTTSCRPCNTSKGARTPEEWRAAK
ncbi:DUF1376 domain-containing protein (plasmid) [Skermanella rosea]|uniref:DUF1376 domain-containing protein n=1 Tax=Skermanella rosea TaxID=1817965 RepID=UPI001933A8CC|nr:DUF1376 domain-containing protein [Skermanella rosea]UEM08088.1 DUF1376 domain-containing protein [Skermanella rosea]